jgi:SAM-dependent methyltransferase
LINSNPFNVFGKIIAPNGIDPISEGKISVISNNTIVQEVFSDSRGNFSFFLNYGNYDLVISKGLFKTESSISLSENSDSFNFDLGDISFDQFPSIGVVTGYYDNIESILYDIGLVNPIDGTPLFDIIDGIDFNRNSNEIYNRNHGNHRVIKNTSKTTGLEPNVDFNFSDLLNNVSLLNQYDVLFLNCGLNTDEAETNESLYNFVNNGGILYATDWTYPFLEKFNVLSGTEYLTFQQPYKSGQSLSTEATILSSELNDWLSINFDLTIDNTVIIDEFLNAWQVVDDYNTSSVIAWLEGYVEYNDENGELVGDNKELAFTFLLGNGGVFYSSFHTENNEDGFSCVDRVMEYMIFELSSLSQ